MAGEENIEIEQCPVCKGSHSYALQVRRSLIFKMMTPGDAAEQPRSVRVTRVFVCPAKGQQFKATITLFDTSVNRIEDVSVKGT